MPRSVRNALLAAIAALLVAGADVVLQGAGVTVQDDPSGSVGMYVLSAILMAVLLTFVVKGYNRGRWVFIALNGLTMVMALPIFVRELETDPLGAASTALQCALLAFAIVALLTPSASAWFTREPAGSGARPR